jgi:hypothetical protein
MVMSETKKRVCYEKNVRLQETCKRDGTQSMPSEEYAKAALKDVKFELDKVGKRLPSKASTPFTSGYHAKVDATPEIDAQRASYYHGQIGVLQWIVELRRIDIMVPVSMLASQLAAP